MADFAALASTTAYLTLLGQISDRDAALALALDPAHATVTTPLTNSVRYSSANKRWEMYNGTAWVELIAATTDAFNMTVTGLKGGTLYGANALAAAATLTGGAGSSIDVPTLKQAGSAVWSAATLTNLNQLINGPAFITSSALSPYAPLAAPALTGVPTAPTAAVDTNTTQIATTAFVIGQAYLKAAAIAAYAPLASPSFTGVPIAPTAAVDTNTTQLATTAYVIAQGYLKAAAAASTYAPLGGAGASGTWGISVTGNAATATRLPEYASRSASVVMTGRAAVDGTYSYSAYGDPNAPASYFAAVGFGQGTAGCGEIGVYWAAAGNGLWYRALRDGIDNWYAWSRVLDDSNYNGYAPTLTGAGASGTWGIGISGNAASATTAAACSGNAASASTVAWSGVTSKPINSITTTTSTSTPTGGVAGDVVFQY